MFLALAWACTLSSPQGVKSGSAAQEPSPARGGSPPLESSRSGSRALGGPVDNVLLIGWDGAERRRLVALLREGRLKNLENLIEEGSFRALTIDGHATDTKPGFVQILTGYDPDVTGVYSNTRYRPVPPGLSVFERAKDALGASNLFTAMVTAKEANLGSVEQGRLVGLFPPRREPLGQPYVHVRTTLDFWDGDTFRDGSKVVAAAARALEQAGARRFLVFVHFRDPDRAGHSAGEASDAYAQAIVACDEWLGRMLDWLRGAGLYDRTRVYVVTDHGFDEGQRSHSSAPRSWLATNDRAVIAGGHLRDVAPTILARMGVPTALAAPPYPGRSLALP
jgi:predicted AlkP superfamily pyrophosphatase or phosphodiesterase